MKRRELLRLQRRAETDLTKYAGVTGVGLGWKERRGVPTDEVAWRVYVHQKKIPAELGREDCIPSIYAGMVTDVIALDMATPTASACEDKNKYSPLVGGITVSNGIPGTSGALGGTLGFFATIQGVAEPNNVALVSNNHVLMANSAATGAVIFQPDLSSGGSAANNPVANILAGPARGDYSFQGQLYYVDAAAAQLKISISSCCKCNCGVSFTNQIHGLNVNGVNTIAGVATAQVGDIVYKVGRETSRTRGKVINATKTIAVDGLSITNAIEIQPLDTNCNGELKFSAEGDSGSAIINDQGQLVGLLFSAAPTQANGLACHIAPVLDALHLTPITLANAPLSNPAFASSALADVSLLIDNQASRTQELRERLLASAEGQHIWALVEQHVHEVVQLVNHNRRVTTAWHRNHGPAFSNRVINNARDPEVRIPLDIEGVTRKALLENMGDILAQQGSAALRAAIEQHREEVLTYAEQCASLHELVERLAERQPV